LSNTLKNKSILERIAMDDKAAFDELFDHFHSRLVNFCYLLVRSYEASEDIVAEIFYQFLKKRKTANRIENLEKYLYQSVRFQVFKFLKKKSAQKFLNYIECPTDYFIDFHSPEKEYLNSELEKILIESIQALPPRRKVIFKMIKEDGLKYNEVAIIMDVSVKTVETHLSLAIRDLKEKIGTYYYSSGRDAKVVKFNY